MGQFRKNWGNGTMSRALELPLLVVRIWWEGFLFESLSYIFQVSAKLGSMVPASGTGRQA